MIRALSVLLENYLPAYTDEFIPDIVYDFLIEHHKEVEELFNYG